ncbi:MAG: hypothetical protein IKW90_06265 [Lachnospiraceae bacterium]|nr:hypothetical protein [Lachnospiraceae bacterium]
MKKAKIVLLISLLIFIGLLLFFIFTTPSKEDGEKPVSIREQYQKELEEKQSANKGSQ